MQHNFHHAEDFSTDQFDIPLQPQQQNSKSIGMLLMGNKEFYDESSTNIHLPLHDLIPSLVANFLKERSCPEVHQITVGHEHGLKNGKCHYQICIDFMSNCRVTIKPFIIESPIPSLTAETFEFLGMVQRARNSHALKNYCKKEGDVKYLYPEKVIKPVFGKKGKIDAFATVYANKEVMSRSEAMDEIFTSDARAAFMAYSNVSQCINTLIPEKAIPFVWNYPKHMIPQFPAPMELQMIYNWYQRYCIKENMDRRKALVLYSKERALGKTRFASSLVNSEEYVLIFRNTFTKEQYETRKDAKLLVLDDMAHYTKDNKEQWKALMTGQPTSIRDCFVNFQFSKSLPCIVTTNNQNLFANMILSPEFNTSAIYVEITKYIGPPGTQPNDLQKIETCYSKEMEELIAKKALERSDYKNLHDK